MGHEERPHQFIGADGRALRSQHQGDPPGQVGSPRPLVALTHDGVELDGSPVGIAENNAAAIIPALDMVVVFNASRQSKNMVAPELDLLDRYILPAASN